MGNSPVDYESARAAYIRERPAYQQLATVAVERLRPALAEVGVRAETSGRAKEVPSYIAKFLRDDRYRSGSRPIQDCAGVRVALPHFGDVEFVDEAVRAVFHIDEREETVERLGADRLGYLAVHYIARLKSAQLDAEQQVLFDGRQLEIQVGSLAQRAWAEVSHALLYKTTFDIPPAQQRLMNRLMALVEVFDDEVERCRIAIRRLPGYEESVVLDALDRELLKFTGRTPDRALSQVVGPQLVRLYAPVEPRDVFPRVLAPWILQKADQLRAVFGDYSDSENANPLLFQPEAFLIFERAENDPTGLQDAWPTALPAQLLESLTELWGAPLN